MIHLQSLRLKDKPGMGDGYPFDLSVIRQLDEVGFRSPVTFFVGENGTGKSTLLEAIAAGAGLATVGGVDIGADETLAPARRLAAHLTLNWRTRTHRGFFMRSEDFFNFAGRTRRAALEFDEMADAFARDRTGDWRRAAGLARAQRASLVERYGEDLDAQSHGESVLHLFRSRFAPGGLYLLDEPDTAFSPQRQVALLALLKETVERDAQFVVATHSPIVLAFPGATILGFDGGAIAEIAYDDVPNVALTRSFLADPAAFLRHL